MQPVENVEENKAIKGNVTRKGKGRGRAAKITPRNIRTPLAEINVPLNEVRIGEKRKFNLLDETENIFSDEDTALKSNLSKKQIKMDRNQAFVQWVMEATPKKPSNPQ